MILLSVRQHKSRLYDTDNDSYLAESHPSTFGEIAVGRPEQGWGAVDGGHLSLYCNPRLESMNVV